MKEYPSPGTRTLAAVLDPFPGKEEELAQALASLLPALRCQPGCLEALGARGLDPAPRFLLHLAWQDAAARDRSLATEAFSVLLGALGTLASGGLPGTGSSPGPPGG